MAAETEAESQVAPARLALLRVYCALDRIRASEPDDDAPPLLEEDLHHVGIEIEGLGAIEDEFARFADEIRRERESAAEPSEPRPLPDDSDESGGRDASDESHGSDGPPSDSDAVPHRPAVIPLVRVVETAMDVVASVGDPDSLDSSLLILAREMVQPASRDDEDVVAEAARILRVVPRGLPGEEDRWLFLSREVAKLPVHADLAGVRRSECHAEGFDYMVEGKVEKATRITTRFEIERGPDAFDGLTWACMPSNWPYCNSFFCELTHRPARDAGCPGTTPGAPQPAASHWRNVYEERVLKCPAGAFPDTFLLFTWCCERPNQLVLQYELAPWQRGDRTVLKLDEGSIQISRLPDGYWVQTVKLLLFDDQHIPSGGQTLAKYACKLGWLDYSIAQFTVCAEGIPKHVGPLDVPASEPDAEERLLAIVDRCEGHLRDRAAEVEGDVDECVAHVRAGDMGFGDCVAEGSQKVATRLARDGATWFEGQIDYALASVELAREAVSKWRRTRA